MKKIGRIFLLSLMAVLFAAGSFAGCASAGGSGGGSSDESSGSAASDSASAPAEVTDREAIGYAFGGVYLNGELEDEERGCTATAGSSKPFRNLRRGRTPKRSSITANM